MSLNNTIEKYNFCYICTKDNNVSKIILYNNKSDVDIPKHHSLIYNPTVYISNNNIVIEGKEDVTIYCDSITYLTDLVYPPQMEYIKYDKGITIFGHKFFESSCYVKRGWYRSEPILDVKYILNQCVIKIIK